MLKRHLKAKYKALPPSEKFKRNLIGIAIWIAVALTGLLIFKSGSGLLGISVIFIGFLGIAESTARALVNFIRSKRQNTTLAE